MVIHREELHAGRSNTIVHVNDQAIKCGIEGHLFVAVVAES